METRRHKIGIFDSGIGGLTVLGACLSVLPETEYYYLGDNARAPYGNRSEEEISRFTEEALGEFLRIGVDAAVLACNTATAVCLGEMREKFPFPVIGTEPAVRLAAKECAHALVLATVRTAKSERLRRLIASCPSCKFTVLACPELAGGIERAVTRGERANLGQLVPNGQFFGEKADGVVLGCTHYVFLRDEIASFYGCKAFDGNLGIAMELRRRLKIGTTDHHNKLKNQNICFEKKVKEMSDYRVIFLGKSGNTNKKVFFSNICFRSP